MIKKRSKPVPCRHCAAPVDALMVDLGYAPPSNAFVKPEQMSSPEIAFPLEVVVCESCWLVQTVDFNRADELFTDDYVYFSSTSVSWLAHARDYCEMMVARMGLDDTSFVVEIASNDGYLLKNFVQQNIPCLGIEPTHSTAKAAIKIGVPTREEFFGVDFAKGLRKSDGVADLIIGNNVLAHVPDINDFVGGVSELLSPEGFVTFEFPHLLNLLKYCQFDTVYHEHYSYLSLLSVEKIFAAHDLKIVDIDKLSTHGGSLRIHGAHKSASHTEKASVQAVRDEEAIYKLNQLSAYENLQIQTEELSRNAIAFLAEQHRLGKKVAGYGAAAKGNTLINFAGIRPYLLPVVADAAPFKQGQFLPGSHIPVCSPDELREYQPDIVVILPWNIAQEIKTQLSDIEAQFVVLSPEPAYL